MHNKFGVMLMLAMGLQLGAFGAWAQENSEMDTVDNSVQVEGAESTPADDVGESGVNRNESTAETVEGEPSSDAVPADADSPGVVVPSQAATSDTTETPTPEQSAAEASEPDITSSLQQDQATTLSVVSEPVPAYAPWPNRNSPRRHLVLLGGGGALGVIYPKAVNNYMSDWLDDQGDITMVEDGFTEMVLSFVPNISFSYSPVEYLNFELFSEFGWAPKIISVQNGESKIFNFLRLSPGLNIMCHIPFHEYRNSFFFGGGAEIDVMRFEEFRANSLGLRGKLGVRILRRRSVVDVFGAMLVTKEVSGEQDGESLELNYTSFLFGASVYFYLHGKE